MNFYTIRTILLSYRVMDTPRTVNPFPERDGRVRFSEAAPFNMVAIAQLVRALDCGSNRWEFKSP